MMHPNMQDFATFARSMPPERHYNWCDSSICACAQFARKTGTRNWTHAQPSVFWNRANEIAGEGLHTFGALAERIDAEVRCMMAEANHRARTNRYMVDFSMRFMRDRPILVDSAF